MTTRTPMSDDARTLLHYASNAREACADDSDREYCMSAARAWATHIIGESFAVTKLRAQRDELLGVMSHISEFIDIECGRLSRLGISTNSLLALSDEARSAISRATGEQHG